MNKTALVLPLLLLVACAGEESSEDVSGALQIEARCEPDPPQVGRNALAIEIRDASGLPVTGAAVTVDPFMPTMGHGSTETPQIVEEGAGSYRAFPVTLQMPGPWQVTVHASDGGAEGEVQLDWVVE